MQAGQGVVKGPLRVGGGYTGLSSWEWVFLGVGRKGLVVDGRSAEVPG